MVKLCSTLYSSLDRNVEITKPIVTDGHFYLTVPIIGKHFAEFREINLISHIHSTKVLAMNLGDNKNCENLDLT